MYKGELMLTAIKLIIILAIALFNLMLVGGYIYLLNKGDVMAAEMLGQYSSSIFCGELIAGLMIGLFSAIS